jgi:nucleotide-binding universal stress UspA family protein
MRHSYIAAHDGTDRAADAVALARLLARPRCAPVRMVHVCRARAASVRVERAQVLGPEERLRVPGDPLPLNLTAHSVALGLQDAAQREPAALIVVASSPGGEMDRTFPGSTAQRLLHGAPCPVAIAPDGYATRHPTTIRVIGVAIDADPESWKALRHAIELARGLDARVRLMTAVDPTAEAEELLHDARAEMPGDVLVETRLCEGPQGEAIVAACDEDVDLLVCGLLGTTTSLVVAHSRCPVLVPPRRAGNGGITAPAGTAGTRRA